MNSLRIKFVKYLIAIIGLAVFANFLPLQAQNSLSSSNLINTLWKVPDIIFDTDLGPATATGYYLFEKDGKIRRKEIAILQSQLTSIPNYQNPMFNPQVNAWIEGGDTASINSPYRMTLSVTPGIIVEIEETGTYEIKGNSLKMNFAGTCKNCQPFSATGNIQPEQISGEYINLKTNKKSTFKLLKVSNIKNQQAVNPNSTETNYSASQKIMRNEPNNQKSQSLSLAESQELMRQESESEKARMNVIKELSKLNSYKAATQITYKNQEIIGNIVIKIKNISKDGRVIAEVSGEKGISLSGTLEAKRIGEETIFLGTLYIDFNSNLGMQKLEVGLGFEVEQNALINGKLYIKGDIKDVDHPNGRFIRAETINYR